MIILIAFLVNHITCSCGKDLASNDAQDSISKLADQLVDKLVARALGKVWPCHHGGLDATTLLKSHPDKNPGIARTGASILVRHSCLSILRSPVSLPRFRIPAPPSQFHSTRSLSTFRGLPMHRSSTAVAASAMAEAPAAKADPSFRMISLNILAPCYKRTKVKVEPAQEADGMQAKSVDTGNTEICFEATNETKYLERNKKIIDLLVKTEADVILLQEFWVANDHLKGMYLERLGKDFEFFDIQRSSHWRKRDDGLACFVRKNKVIVQDTRDIVFHDCGDRVAKMLLLALPSDVPGAPLRQLIVVNTHLLFPHNIYSTQIRKREITKILGFVDSYRENELRRTGSSGDSVVKLPVIISGDFNGSPDGQVHSLLVQQRYRNSYVEYTGKLDWVSHRSHRQENIPVDHIMLLNPSDQDADKLRPTTDWTNLVYQEVYKEIVGKWPKAVDAMREAFRAVDQDKNNALDKEEFANLLETLGFSGEGRPTLTPEEVELLVASADVNGDGTIDFKEFLDRFWMAGNVELKENIERELDKSFPEAPSASSEINSYACSGWLEETEELTGTVAATGAPAAISPVEKKQSSSGTSPSFDTVVEKVRPCGDLAIKDARLYPSELEQGKWPESWDLSDHGMLVVDFLCKPCPA